MDGQENLERTWKVREKSGNLKIKGMAGSFQKIYLFCSRGERMYFLMRKSKPISSSFGAILKEKKIAPLRSKFFPLRVTPKLEVKQHH